MSIRTEEVTFSGTSEDTRQWILVLQQITGGGTPKKETRESFQHFRWVMMQNLNRIQDSWAALKKEMESERQRILIEQCGSEERFCDYTAAIKMAFGPFSKYMTPTGAYELPKGDVQRRFKEMERKMTKEYADIAKAGEMFAARQAQMFAQKIEVKLLTCDYSEVPDDINCAYLDFLKTLIMGMPTLECYHGILKRRQRYDLDFAASMLATISKELHGDTVAASRVMTALFAEAAEESK